LNSLPNSVSYIFGYIRRSRQDIARERKTNQDTLTEQRDLITDILKQIPIDWDIKEEIGSGGDTIDSRPIFKALIEHLKTIKPRSVALAVKEISRLGRGDYSQIGIVYDVLIEKQIFIITPFKIYDPLDPEDQMALKFYMFIANIELDMTKRRLRESRYTYARQGRWMTGGGGIPFGYDFNGFTQKLVPNETTAPIVKRIYDMYVTQKLGYNAISTHLRKEGVPTPNGKEYWQPMVLRRILLNPVYKGTVQFKTTRVANKKKIQRPEEDWIIVPNAHPPIIDEETWDKAQATLEANRNSPRVRLDFEPNPLASLVICAGCKKKMIRQSSTQYYKKQDGNTSKYIKEFMTCKGCSVYLKYKPIEDEIIRLLREDIIQPDPDQLRAKLTEFINLDKERSKSFDPAGQVERISTEIESLNSELKRLRVLLRKELITEEEFQEDRDEIQKQLREKEFQLAAMQNEARSDRVQKIDVDAFQRGLDSLVQVYLYGELSKGEKNELLLGVFDLIELEFVRKGKFNLRVAIKSTLIK